VKFHKYARSGVPNYWIVDPEARKLEAFELQGERYRRVAELKDRGSFQPALFPGLTIDLEPLWPI
jgi:Uma2 family endonuclease